MDWRLIDISRGCPEVFSWIRVADIREKPLICILKSSICIIILFWIDNSNTNVRNWTRIYIPWENNERFISLSLNSPQSIIGTACFGALKFKRRDVFANINCVCSYTELSVKLEYSLAGLVAHHCKPSYYPAMYGNEPSHIYGRCAFHVGSRPYQSN